MTEQEWLTCAEPKRMLAFRQGRALWRRRLLYGCACSRLVWAWLPADSRRAAEACERHADAPATARADAEEAVGAAEESWQRTVDEVRALVGEPRWGGGWDEPGLCCYRDASVASLAAWGVACLANQFAPDGRRHSASATVESAVAGVSGALRMAVWRSPLERQRATREARTVRANLLRDVFGNPFRPVALAPAWSTTTVVALAQAAYDERLLPSGHLDPARLAILSDALEEAGCSNANLLSHLRLSNPHVRGCFVVDALLGKMQTR